METLVEDPEVLRKSTMRIDKSIENAHQKSWQVDPRILELTAWVECIAQRLSYASCFATVRTPATTELLKRKQLTPRTRAVLSFSDECWWSPTGIACWERATLTSSQRFVYLSTGAPIDHASARAALSASKSLRVLCSTPLWATEPFVYDFLMRSARLFTENQEVSRVAQMPGAPLSTISEQAPNAGNISPKSMDNLFHVVPPSANFFECVADVNDDEAGPLVKWCLPLVTRGPSRPSAPASTISTLIDLVKSQLSSYPAWNCNSGSAGMIIEALMRRSHPEIGDCMALMNPNRSPEIIEAATYKRSLLFVLAFTHAVTTFVAFDEPRALTLLHTLVRTVDQVWMLLVQTQWHALNARASLLLAVACILEDDRQRFVDAMALVNYDIATHAVFTLDERLASVIFERELTETVNIVKETTCTKENAKKSRAHGARARSKSVKGYLNEYAVPPPSVPADGEPKDEDTRPATYTESMRIFAVLIYTALEVKSHLVFKHLITQYAACWAILMSKPHATMRDWSAELPAWTLTECLLLTDTFAFLTF